MAAVVTEVPRLSHLDEAGRAVMVDVSAKPMTARAAVAAGRVAMRPETLARIMSGGMPKGDVFAAARIAGIMAAKRTAELIPLCHPLPISAVALTLAADDAGGAVLIEATVRTTGRTGVEMEALTAVTVAALTLYDMCKAIDRGMRIEGVHVLSKTGGKSGTYEAALCQGPDLSNDDDSRSRS